LRYEKQVNVGINKNTSIAKSESVQSHCNKLQIAQKNILRRLTDKNARREIDRRRGQTEVMTLRTTDNAVLTVSEEVHVNKEHFHYCEK